MRLVVVAVVDTVVDNNDDDDDDDDNNDVEGVVDSVDISIQTESLCMYGFGRKSKEHRHVVRP